MMKNNILYKLRSKIRLRICGKNINRFIIRLNTNGIDILKSFQINKDEIDIIIYSSDYDNVLKLKTIYNIDKIDEYGFVRIKKGFFRNKYIIFGMVLGYCLLIFLCNIIYEVDIIHNDDEIRGFLRRELNQYGIRDRTIKKSYKEIQRIKNDIINNNRDRIEWLEIEVVGTKYVVRVEPRIMKKEEETLQNRNIIAKKDCIIKKIVAEQGQILKEVNNYVKKGDVIVSGNIYVDENIKNTVVSKGEVYGEVWYEINVSYPFIYNEVRLTNNKKNVLAIRFLNKIFEFTRKRFKDKKIDEKVIIKNTVVPFSLVFQKQVEQYVIDQILTKDEALERAVEVGISKIKNNLGENEHIIDYKVLDSSINDNGLELNMFFSVYENVTDYETIIQDESME